MFSFLIAIGLIFIIFGIFINRNEVNHEVAPVESIDNRPDGLNEIINRIEVMEDEIRRLQVKTEEIKFIDILDSVSVEEIEEVESEEDFEDEKDSEIGEGTKEAFEIISLYNEGRYSLDQVCKILNMNKGEVLLLKNLYAKSQE